jgi:hypothetical protein
VLLNQVVLGRRLGVFQQNCASGQMTNEPGVTEGFQNSAHGGISDARLWETALAD